MRIYTILLFESVGLGETTEAGSKKHAEFSITLDIYS
jgi:hypothetical protein